MRGFLGYLSHECRVPLQVVLAGLEVLSGADGGSSLDGGECFLYSRMGNFNDVVLCAQDPWMTATATPGRPTEPPAVR